MTYEVQNKKTQRVYVVDEATYKSLDMKRKYLLLSSWDEAKKPRAIIPEEIIIKSTKTEKVKVERPKAETKNDIND